MKLRNVIYLILILIPLLSCHIQRPLYTKRFHIQWIANDRPKVIEPGNPSEHTLQKAPSSPTLWAFSDSDSVPPIVASEDLNLPKEGFILLEKSSGETLIFEGSGIQREHSRKKPLNGALNSEIRKNTLTKNTPTFFAEKSPRNPKIENNFSRDGKKLEVMSLLSMIFAISGLFMPYVGFGLIVSGLVLGIVGLIRIQKHSDTYWGRGFAIAGISVSAFALTLFLSLFLLLGSLYLLAV